MLQSIWVPDSRPTRVIAFGTVEEILAMKSNAQITEAYADTGEILMHWQGRKGWVKILTEEVEILEDAQGGEVVEDSLPGSFEGAGSVGDDDQSEQLEQPEAPTLGDSASGDGPADDDAAGDLPVGDAEQLPT